MLTSMQSPAVCRFLADVSYEGKALLNSFDWGTAWGFPFLPRVQVGRIVLSEAQWRIDTLTRTRELPVDTPRAFREALRCWRSHWRVPRYAYLSFGDNRLLLDLENIEQVEELRTELRHLREGGSLVLQEVLPALDQIWMQGPEGHYMTEIVTSLVLRPSPVQHEHMVEAAPVLTCPDETASLIPPPAATDCLKPPGSEWLFVKLYCTTTYVEDLIAYPIRTFATQALSSGLAEEWFIIRYTDPDLHIRLRFHGQPERLIGLLLPELCTWATGLMAQHYCSRFVFDTYDRELERYGGTAGTQLAESLFAADSNTVCTLLNLINERLLNIDRITLGVLSVDNLLAGLGLTQMARLAWLEQNVTSRNQSGQEYRQRKKRLRSLLHDPNHLLNELGGELIAQTFAAQRTALAPIVARLKGLTERRELSHSLDVLNKSFVHLHCNRLFGSDNSTEPLVLGLLLRTRQGLKASDM